MCPRGDDPLTLGQDFRIVKLETKAARGTFKGEITLTFNGEDVTVPAAASELTASTLQTKLESLPNLESVTVTRSDVDDNQGSTWTITIVKFPTIPHENNIYYHSGNPPITAFSCDLSKQDELFSPSCEFTDVNKKNLIEYAPCSNQGECSARTGQCACNPGFHGSACQSNKDDVDVQLHSSEGPFFTGSILRLRSARDRSERFDFFNVEAAHGGDAVFKIGGDGDVTTTGNLKTNDVTAGSLSSTSLQTGSITASTLSIDSGDDSSNILEGASSGVSILTVSSKGDIRTKGTVTADSLNTVSAVVDSTGLSVEGLTKTTDLEVSGGVGVDGDVDISGDLVLGGGVRSIVDGREVFNVEKTGTTTIGGGLEVKAGGGRIEAGGLEVSGGFTVSGGIVLESGGLTINDGEGGMDLLAPFSAQVSAVTGHAIKAGATDAQYSGVLVDLKAPEVTNEQYFFIAANDDVFTVSGNGGIGAESMNLGGDANIGGMLTSKSVVLPPNDIRVAGDDVELDLQNGSFFTITSGKTVVISDSTPPKPGQLLLISNASPNEITFGSNKIPSSTLLLFFYTTSWTELTVSAAHTKSLDGVSALKATADLDIGPHSLTADRLISAQGKMEEGRILYYAGGGVMTGVPDVTYDKSTETMSMKKAKFEGVVGEIDFAAATIKNAALTDPSITGIKHLELKSLSIKEEETQTGNRFARVGLIDDNGLVFTSEGLRLERGEGVLRVGDGGIGGAGSGKGKLSVVSDLNLENNTLSDFKLIEGTVLESIVVKGGRVVDAILENATAIGLDLGDIEVEAITVREMKEHVGGILIVEKEGKVTVAGSALKFVVDEESALETLRVGVDVEMKAGKTMKLEEVVGGTWKGGKLEEVVKLEVTGSVDVKGDLNVGGETSMDGSLVVGGSVLGSGPYIDASDSRFKKDVHQLSDALGRISNLRGVSYEVDEGAKASVRRSMSNRGREMGFIAQEVQDIFPELVSEAEDGYLGVSYSRMTAALVEAVKELKTENEELKSRLEKLEETVFAAK